MTDLKIMGNAFKDVKGVVLQNSSGKDVKFIQPSGSIYIDENGTYDVSKYSKAEVDAGVKLNVQESVTITPSASGQEIYPDQGYDVFEVAYVDPIPSKYIIPNGTVQAANNGTYDVSHYNSIVVNVPNEYVEPDVEKLVNFIDYDGTLLYSYSAEEFAELQELPLAPIHDGLVAEGWNWTIEEIQDQLESAPNAPVYVGQMYITASGATEIDITLEDGYLSPYLQVYVYYNTTLVINWGDGNSDTIKTTSSVQSFKWQQHIYDSPGNYTISITRKSSLGGFYFGCPVNLGASILSDKSDGTSSYLYNNTIKRIRLGSGLHTSVSCVFDYCNSLESITFPKYYTRGGSFNYCRSLKSITLSTETSGVSGCSNCISLLSVSIPKSARIIGDFSYCSSLSNITIPNKVNTIYASAFNGCTSLKSIVIPNDVTEIKPNVFDGCVLLSDVSLSSNLTTIGNYAFRGCKALNKITLPSSLTSIGFYVFDKCLSLTSIVIPNGVKSIGQYSFNTCGSLVNIELPDALTSIESGLFTQCRSISKLTIPSNVSKIAVAFSTCSSLKEMHLLSITPPTISGSNFNSDYLPTSCLFYVPEESLEAYKSDATWSRRADYILAEPKLED